MNDNELDELLNSWGTPGAPASMRERVRSGFRAQFRRGNTVSMVGRWFGALMPRAGTIAAIGVFLLVLTKAAPMVLWAPSAAANAPYIVETEHSTYTEDGASTIDLYSASYDKDGKEIPLSRSLQDNPLGTAELRFGGLLGLVHLFLLENVHGIHPEPLENISALRQAGCALDTVVARETILNYQTVAVRHLVEGEKRRTVWRAPELGCFTLQKTMEVRRADGSFRLYEKNQALNVTVNKARGA